MEESVLYFILWDHWGLKTCLYGTGLRRMADGRMEFENAGLPPGTVIREWNSYANYQADRSEPQLPTLPGGETWRLRMFMETVPGDTAMVRTEFYDRSGERIGFRMAEGTELAFELPGETYRYKVQLIQAGSRKICFHHGELWRAEAPMLSRIMNRDRELPELNVVIPQVRGRMAAVREKEWRALPNVTAVSMEALRADIRNLFPAELPSGFRETERVNLFCRGKEFDEIMRRIGTMDGKGIKWNHVRAFSSDTEKSEFLWG